MIARLGPVRALLAGLVVAALGGALRGAVPAAAWLYATTMLMAAGVAIMQPALPALVRLWAPQRIGFATAVYSNGLLVGEDRKSTRLNSSHLGISYDGFCLK